MGENDQMTAVAEPQAEGINATPKSKLGEIARFTKKRPKKKKIILIAIAALLVIVVVIKLAVPADTRPNVDVSALSKGELTNRITLSGVVESGSATRIYSEEKGIVQQINVKVGDHVDAGDLMCELDTADIERAIAMKENTIKLSSQKSQLTLEDSTQKYNDLYEDMQNDNYTSLISAQQTLNYAQRDYADARRALDDHEDEQEYADEVILKLEREMAKAQQALSRAKKTYNNAVKGDDRDAEEAARVAMIAAEQVYQDAFDKWDDANDEYGEDVTKYTDDFRQARLKYNDALEDKELAERTAARSLASYKRSMEMDVIDADLTNSRLELEELQESLANSNVTAPISGTVTAVYALDGMPGTGLLFVIENTDDLIIKTSVREYDVTSVKPGQAAVIKSDATGETAFDGEVLRIAPAAQKDKEGSTQESTSVKFDTDVALKTPDSGLRIGMNVRLNVILEKREDVLSVPYDAVITDENGGSAVLVAKEQDGKYIAQQVAVTTGLETDFDLEIISDELAEGDLVILNPAGVKAGDEVVVSSGADLAASEQGA